MFCVSCKCCVLLGRGLCVGPITRPEKSYRLWCVWMRSWSLNNEEALAKWGSRSTGGNKTSIADHYMHTCTYIGIWSSCVHGLATAQFMCLQNTVFGNAVSVTEVRINWNDTNVVYKILTWCVWAVGTIYQNERCHIPGDHNINQRDCDTAVEVMLNNLYRIHKEDTIHCVMIITTGFPKYLQTNQWKQTKAAIWTHQFHVTIIPAVWQHCQCYWNTTQSGMVYTCQRH